MIIELNNLANIRKQHKNESIVLTSGTFDLLHVGHLEYLEAVKALGDIAVVMLSSDARVQARKGSTRPIIPEADRAKMLDALRMVDYVFIDPISDPQDSENPLFVSILDTLQPDVYATDGPDPRFWPLLPEDRRKILDRTETNVSTTAIIARITS